MFVAILNYDCVTSRDLPDIITWYSDLFNTEHLLALVDNSNS